MVKKSNSKAGTLGFSSIFCKTSLEVVWERSLQCMHPEDDMTNCGSMNFHRFSVKRMGYLGASITVPSIISTVTPNNTVTV